MSLLKKERENTEKMRRDCAEVREIQRKAQVKGGYDPEKKHKFDTVPELPTMDYRFPG